MPYKINPFTGELDRVVGLDGAGIVDFIPDTGTSPVVPSGAGTVTMTGGNGILTTGGLNTLTFDMQSPFTGDFAFTESITVGDAGIDNVFIVNGASLTARIAQHTSGASDLGGFVSERHSSTAAFGAHSLFLRTKGVEGSPTVVADDDVLSRMVSCGYDGTDYAQSAEIRVEVDGTPGNDDMPGRIVFLTSPDGSQTPAEALRITSEQYVGINTPVPLDNLHITGSQRITHTATENDDHAIEIDCDAAGFGDMKALDIDFITGAMAAGQDEEVMLVNIDETLSTGGEISGYQVLSTSEGSASICGYTTGININPILHNSGVFGDTDSILNKAVDVTAALASGGAGSISLFVADDDTVTIGDAAQFNELEILLATGASAAGIAPTWEYSTGGTGFTAFSPSDGTNGFRNTGSVLWIAADLSGWIANATGFLEVRITRTRNNLGTTPIADEIQISSTTEFSWDLNGDVSINSLALVSPLTVPNGGTGVATLADGGIILGSGTGAVTVTAQPASGELLIGSVGVDPVLATLTAGTGVSIVEGAGSITISGTGGGMTWTVETGTTRTMTVNTGNIGNNAANVAFTLPDTAAVGDMVSVTGLQALWNIVQNAGDTIHFGESSTTTGAGGSVTSTEARDVVTLVCVVANTDWQIISSIGNLTLV